MEQKQKPKKKATFGNIGYNSGNICTDSVFALQNFLLIQSNLSCSVSAAGSTLETIVKKKKKKAKHISGRLLKCRTFFYKGLSVWGGAGEVSER